MHGVVCNTLYEIRHTFLVGYQDEEEGDDEREMAWLVGGKVHMSGQAEQELGKTYGGKG